MLRLRVAWNRSVPDGNWDERIAPQAFGSEALDSRFARSYECLIGFRSQRARSIAERPLDEIISCLKAKRFRLFLRVSLL